MPRVPMGRIRANSYFSRFFLIKINFFPRTPVHIFRKSSPGFESTQVDFHWMLKLPGGAVGGKVSWQPLDYILPRPRRSSGSSDQSDPGQVLMSSLEPPEDRKSVGLKYFYSKYACSLFTEYKISPHTLHVIPSGFFGHRRRYSSRNRSRIFLFCN